jgi:signal transduction histidine kinase
VPGGDVDRIFVAGARQMAGNPGHGLGLSTARRSVEANGGMLTVRDIPGTGCAFTIDLPRYASVVSASKQPVPTR